MQQLGKERKVCNSWPKSRCQNTQSIFGLNKVLLAEIFALCTIKSDCKSANTTKEKGLVASADLGQMKISCGYLNIFSRFLNITLLSGSVIIFQCVSPHVGT